MIPNLGDSQLENANEKVGGGGAGEPFGDRREVNELLRRKRKRVVGRSQLPRLACLEMRLELGLEKWKGLAGLISGLRDAAGESDSCCVTLREPN